MAETHPILLAALVGMGSALFLSMLPGPINLTILHEGPRRGFRWAFLIGFGAAVMDAIYCGVSFTGFSQFIDHGIVKASMQVLGFVFLLFIGFRFLMAKSVTMHTKLDEASEKIETSIEHKFHPHSAFMTGFVRVAANLGVLVAWVFVSAGLLAHDLVDETVFAKATCAFGVFLGATLWFLFISFVVSRGHGKFSEKTLLRLQHFSGLGLITTAVFEGAHVAWQLARHKL
jgi:threonine/homoserine/homoserine lactone efflux protein